MKRIIFLLCVFLSIAFFSYSQDFVMKGYLVVNNSRIKYEINLKIIDQTKLEGISITGKGSNYETKAKIEGKYNKKENTILFKEVANLYSKAAAKNIEFCFVQGKFHVVNKNHQSIITGNFYGKDSKNRDCGAGTIFLSTMEELNKMIDSLMLLRTNEYSMPNIEDRPLQNIDTIQNTFLTSQNLYIYKTKSKFIDIRFSDFSNFDNDSIALIINNKIIYDSLRLTDKWNQYTLKLSENNTDTIRYKALNEGSVSPNTSSFILYDGIQQKIFKFNINGLKNDEIILLITQHTE